MGTDALVDEGHASQDLPGTSKFKSSLVDRHLLERIRIGDADTWNDFVISFHARLYAFAIRQVDQHATAEDLVQETFIACLKMLSRFREECDLETLLFQILRRRIVDYYRSKGRMIPVHACEGRDAEHGRFANFEMRDFLAADPATNCVRDDAKREETLLLAEAIHVTCWRLRERRKFRDLKIAEGAIYALIPNQALADLLSCPRNEVAVVKHRLVAKLSNVVLKNGKLREIPSDDLAIEQLADAWESLRPSCPKRSTLGKFLLDLLPSDWDDYVRFHTSVLGCRFCLANLEELSVSRETPSASTFSERLFQSTIGFLSHTP